MASFVARIDEPQQPHEPHAVWAQTVWGLEIVRGQARQMFRPIPGPVFLIGTAVDCDLVLADDAFPETYLYLYVKDDVVSVRRFGLGPELFIDEVETDVAELPLGSVIQFGPYAFRLTQQTGGGPGPRPEPDDSPHDESDGHFVDDCSADALDAFVSNLLSGESTQAAVDRVKALLADVRASLQGERETQTLRLYSGNVPQASRGRPPQRQIA
jgi:hypothetical protein